MGARRRSGRAGTPGFTHERAGEENGGDFVIGTTVTARVTGRKTWGAKPPNKKPGLSYERYDKSVDLCKHFVRITVHHTVGDYDVAGVQERHQNPGWFQGDARADIGYHLFIDKDGKICEGRPLCYIGSHSELDNTGNIGIVLRGNFESGNPSQAQLDALKRLIQALKEMCPNAFVGGVSTHKERKAQKSPKNPTECPGKNLEDDVKRIAKELGMEPK